MAFLRILAGRTGQCNVFSLVETAKANSIDPVDLHRARAGAHLLEADTLEIGSTAAVERRSRAGFKKLSQID